MSSRSLTLVEKIAPDPLGLTYNEVVFGSYPIPSFVTITSVISPLTITGRNDAPVPPLTSVGMISGIEKYSDPLPKT